MHHPALCPSPHQSPPVVVDDEPNSSGSKCPAHGSDVPSAYGLSLKMPRQ
ncbi:hypothetical protein A2U01_0100895, partial [Trifolium medium]|nr:hypothetical protein [Trifolium medium]